MFTKLLANIQVGHARPLTKRYVTNGLGGFLVVLAVCMLIVFWLLGVDGISSSPVLFASLITAGMLVFFGLNYLEMRAFRKRPHEFQQFAAQHGLQYAPHARNGEDKLFEKSGLLQIHNVREPAWTNFLKGEDWEYGEFSYKIYRKSRYGENHTETVYYSVMSTSLPRELPNMFFDSKKARGRQFRFEFDSSQLHELEGDFNQYFATYFPNWYTIDGLAIITPDVMQALKDAASYDIELVGNRIYLYGPVYAVQRQLPDMMAKIRPIRQQLLDNILTYRDERLPYQQGRQRVTPLGATLKRSKFWNYVAATVAAVYILLRIIAAILGE